MVNAVSLKRYILCYFSSVIVQDTDSKKKADMFQKKIFCLNNVTEIKIFCLNNVTEIKVFCLNNVTEIKIFCLNNGTKIKINK